MHVNADRLIVEFLDKEGCPVLPGQPGRVIVTDLFNYAMPFIRYDIEDLATPLGKVCRCGRGLPLMAELVGRLADVLTTPEGAFVSASALSTIIPEIPGVRETQFVQMAVDWLQVKVVRREQYSLESERAFSRRLAELFGPQMRITFVYVDSIPKTSSGKARLSVSEGQTCAASEVGPTLHEEA
jgi:phenylacetate-CoA ligase